MHSTGRDVRVALAALALVLMACGTSARGSDVPEQLRALFESGSKGTPSAVAAAKAKYDALRAAHPTDPRIDYAYAVVLINQRKYREATEILARYLATDEPQLAAYCLQIGALVPLRESSKVLEQAVALAKRLRRSRQAHRRRVNWMPPDSWARYSDTSSCRAKAPSIRDY